MMVLDGRAASSTPPGCPRRTGTCGPSRCAPSTPITTTCGPWSTGHAPTWIVEWVDFEAWNETAGARLRADVAERYVEHGLGCDDRPVYLLKGVARPDLTPDCD